MLLLLVLFLFRNNTNILVQSVTLLLSDLKSVHKPLGAPTMRQKRRKVFRYIFVQFKKNG